MFGVVVTVKGCVVGRVSWWAWVGAAAVVVVGSVVVAVGFGGAVRADDGGQPASLVEDFSYPGAAGVEAAHPGVHLVSGDGHILFGECSTVPAGGVGRIVVEISSQTAVCFDVTAAGGVLNLRVAGVDSIDARKAGGAGGRSATATIQPEGGAAATVALDANFVTPVGRGADVRSPATTLLQLLVKAA